jgi:acetolactate decarboxylase
MKITNRLVLGLVLIISACSTPPANTVFQVSTIDALMAGVYEGHLTGADLLGHGDFGIGTFADLDGEMIVLHGKIYQVVSSGKVNQPDLSVKTPFAEVCRFRPDMSFPVEGGVNYSRLRELISQKAPNQNLFYAIRITGRFRAVRTRSVPRQSKPYPLLSEVTAHQPEFAMEDLSGTIVGFRFPAFSSGIAVPGYHLHFLSSDGTRGGHLLECELISGICEVDILQRFMLSLPEGDGTFRATDLSVDRNSEYQQVEGGTSR